MTVQECQAKTTSFEFQEWMRFLEIDMNAFHREDYFLAAIAQEVRRSWVKNPRNVELDPFLFKFETAKKKIESTTARSKQYWFARMGKK